MSLELGRVYSRLQINEMLGGSIQAYLPVAGGRVTCGCFVRSLNPNAPDEVLFGRPDESPDINKAADLVFKQGQEGEAIPVFLKLDTNQWEYRGEYLCIGITRDERVVQRKMIENPLRGKFHGLLRFEQVA